VHDRAIRSEFTHQAESFAASAAATDEQLLGSIVALAAPRDGERWLEVACGPGIIARRLAECAGSVHGVDLTPAMVELAAREAARNGLANVTFAVGDATALPWPDASFDGAVSRFALHHIPLPGRLIDELARVLAPGGHAIVVDHLADREPGAAAWSQEIERLRDPSHWACLDAHGVRELVRRAGLAIERELVVPFELDFDDWLRRGSGGAGAAELIELALATRPAGTECFHVSGEDGRRTPRLQVWLSRLARP
jgi:SAM-dependent methyltransferase